MVGDYVGYNAAIQSLFANAKLNGLDPARWLANTLENLPTCHNSKILDVRGDGECERLGATVRKTLHNLNLRRKVGGLAAYRGSCLACYSFAASRFIWRKAIEGE